MVVVGVNKDYISTNTSLVSKALVTSSELMETHQVDIINDDT